MVWGQPRFRSTASQRSSTSFAAARSVAGSLPQNCIERPGWRQRAGIRVVAETGAPRELRHAPGQRAVGLPYTWLEGQSCVILLRAISIQLGCADTRWERRRGAGEA